MGQSLPLGEGSPQGRMRVSLAPIQVTSMYNKVQEAPHQSKIGFEEPIFDSFSQEKPLAPQCGARRHESCNPTPAFSTSRNLQFEAFYCAKTPPAFPPEGFWFIGSKSSIRNPFGNQNGILSGWRVRSCRCRCPSGRRTGSHRCRWLLHPPGESCAAAPSRNRA